MAISVQLSVPTGTVGYSMPRISQGLFDETLGLIYDPFVEARSRAMRVSLFIF